MKKLFILSLAITLVFTSCIGSMHYKKFILHGSTFFQNNSINYDQFSISTFIQMGGSRDPIKDSTYGFMVKLSPAFDNDEFNSFFMNNFELKGVLINRMGVDSSGISFSVIKETISECGDLKTDYCGYYNFSDIVIPSIVDTIEVSIGFSYIIDGKYNVRDTTVRLFRADDSHTGIIDH